MAEWVRTVRIWFKYHGMRNWPLFAGTLLLVLGAIKIGLRFDPYILDMPLDLIAIATATITVGAAVILGISLVAERIPVNWMNASTIFATVSLLFAIITAWELLRAAGLQSVPLGYELGVALTVQVSAAILGALCYIIGKTLVVLGLWRW